VHLGRVRIEKAYIRTKLRSFLTAEHGLTTSEWGLLTGLFSAMTVVLFEALGHSLSDLIFSIARSKG
jgi:Flp pilus assembly pilin Flp